MKRNQLSGNTITATAGAVTILVSLSFSWYALRLPAYDIDFDMHLPDLISDPWGVEWSLWIGSALPLIAAIILASITLLSVIYYSLKGKENAYLWGRLGMLSGMSIIVNALYILFWWSHHFSEWMINIVNPGVIVAFCGAVIMSLSYPGFRKIFLKWK